MRKKILSETAIYYGDVSMPKKFNIDSLSISKSIIESLYTKQDYTFTKEFDKLNSYVIEYMRLKYNLVLSNRKMYGSIYIPNENDSPPISVNPMDLTNSPDFTLLYGVNTVDCLVKIYYDNNRIKNLCEEIDLKQNLFVMFPSTCSYNIINNQKNNLNFIQTITYEIK